MLAIVFFQESRSILVALEAVENPPAHERIHAILKLSGYEETPASFVLLAAGQDIVIAEVDTVSLADLGATKDGTFEGDERDAAAPHGPLETFAEELDAVGVWSPVVPSPLADLIEAAEAAAFPEEDA